MLSTNQVASYEEHGYVVVGGPPVVQLKARVRARLKQASLTIAGFFEEARPHRHELDGMTLAGIVDWCVHREADQRITRAFYEVWPAVPDVLSVVNDPVIHGLAVQLGVRAPLPSFPPLLRIDRPGDEFFRTHTHQDYWYTMLSRNGIILWIPLAPLSEEMGYLHCVPGSHKSGFLPYRGQEAGDRHSDDPFFPKTLRDEIPDERFVPLPVGERELLAYSMFLVHCSGFNSSERTRVTLQLGFNDLESLESPTSSYVTGNSRYVRNRQRELLG